MVEQEAGQRSVVQKFEPKIIGLSWYSTSRYFLFLTDEEELKPVDPGNPEARWVEKDKVADLLTHYKDKEFFLSIAGGL